MEDNISELPIKPLIKSRYQGYAKELRKRTIDELKELRAQATHDTLTGLLNKGGLEESVVNDIAIAMREKTDISIIYIDLKRFKEVNDKCGHLTGDKILIIAGQVMENSIRKTDHVGRIGGDEFVVACYSASTEEARTIAERMRIDFEEQAETILGNGIKPTFNIGISEVGEMIENLPDNPSGTIKTERLPSSAWEIVGPDALYKNAVEIADHRMYLDKNLDGSENDR